MPKEAAEIRRDIINISKNQEKTFILTEKDGVKRGYLNNIAASTIGKRRM